MKLFTSSTKTLVLIVTVSGILSSVVLAGITTSEQAERSPFWSSAIWFLGTTVIASFVGFLVNWWQSKQTENRAKRQAKEAEMLKDQRDKATSEREGLLTRVKDLEGITTKFSEKLALLDQQATPIIEAIRNKMIEQLTHPSPEFKIPDALLAKVKTDNVITPELEVMLKERETSTHPEVTNGEKLAAAALPLIIKLVVIEKATISELGATQQLVLAPLEPAAKVAEEAEKAA